MIWLALGLAGLAFYLTLMRRKPVFKRREWRVLSAALALAGFTGGAYAALRGSWAIGVVLIVVGLWLASSARQAGPAQVRSPPAGGGRMSDAEARRILGVGEGATPEEIQAAYTRLMRSVHPDTGGTAGLAAQLNAARDRLLGKESSRG
jgi:hypothetical protein